LEVGDILVGRGVAMAYAMTKERAYALIDGLEPAGVPAAVAALELVAAPVKHSLVQVPLEEEEISVEEEAAVPAVKADTLPNLSMEQILADLGFTQADIERGTLPEIEQWPEASELG